MNHLTKTNYVAAVLTIKPSSTFAFDQTQWFFKVCQKDKCVLPPSCKQDLDCSKDRICENGVCANIECKSDRYCPSRAKCNETSRSCRSKEK